MKKLTFIIASLLLIQTHSLWAQTASEMEFQEYLGQNDFSGAVILQDAEGRLSTSTSGFSDLDEATPIKTQDQFKIASITKLFTAVLVMQLVDEGSLSLEDKVSAFLPDMKITNAEDITIRHLLQHTSGLQKESNISYLKSYSPDQLIVKFATKKALFQPGEEFNYNNIDFVILGRIIEEITDQTYQQVLTDRIIQPLGLNQTGLLTEKETKGKVVQAFQFKKSELKKEFNIHIENYWAAGSMYSTVGDLLTFTNALKTEELISNASKVALFESSPQRGYAALGCWTFNSPFIPGSPKVMERRGEILGSTSAIMTSLDGPETVIVLSNTDQFNPDSFGNSENIKEHLFKTLFTQKD